MRKYFDSQAAERFSPGPTKFLLLATFALLSLAACGGGEGGEVGTGGSGGGDPEVPIEEIPGTEKWVCSEWQKGHRLTGGRPWDSGFLLCDEGNLHGYAIADTVWRLNMFRKLAGLPPVTDNPDDFAKCQACAVVMNANQDLDHFPPEDWTCNSSLAEAGASSSNLSLGTWIPADSIDGFMFDAGENNRAVGHRRWFLNFELGSVGVGHAGNATCVSVFDRSATSEKEWTAYPYPGFTPWETVLPRWSFHAREGIDERTEVELHRVSDGQQMRIDYWMGDKGAGPDAMVWNVLEQLELRETYRVSIHRWGFEVLEYEVIPVDCA